MQQTQKSNILSSSTLKFHFEEESSKEEALVCCPKHAPVEIEHQVVNATLFLIFPSTYVVDFLFFFNGICFAWGLDGG